MAKGKSSITLEYKRVINSGRENHFAIFADGKIIADVSGPILKVPENQAIHMLSEQALKKRGLNKSEIEAYAHKVESEIESFLEQSRQAENAEQRELFRIKATDLKREYESSLRPIDINVGLEEMVCVIDQLTITPNIFPYSKETMERIKHWKYEPIKFLK